MSAMSTGNEDEDDITIAAPSTSKPAKAARAFACSYCPKMFKRSEHRSRHERSHTQEKPFSCRYCHRRYARSDLVNRHEKSFHPHADNPRPDAYLLNNLVGDDDVFVVKDTINATTSTSAATPPSRSSHPPSPTTPQSNASLSHDYSRADDISPRAAKRARLYSSATTAPLDPPSPTYTPPPPVAEDVLNRNLLSFDPPATIPTHSRSEHVPMTLDLTHPGEISALAQYDASNEGHSVYDSNSNNNNNNNNNNNVNNNNVDINDTSTSDIQQSIADLSAWEYTNVINVVPPLPVNKHLQDQSSQAPLFDGLHNPSYFDDFEMLSMIMGDASEFPASFPVASPMRTRTVRPCHENVPHGHSPDQQALPVAALERSPRASTYSWGTRDPMYAPAPAKRLVVSPSTAHEILARMPRVLKETSHEVSIPVVKTETYESIMSDVRSRLNTEFLTEFNMLSSKEMQRFVTSYFTCFHRHCPVLHMATLDVGTTPSHLVLAICAIGASYRLERKLSKSLWRWADCIINKPHAVTQEVLSPGATASAQCRFLLGMYAVFSGDFTERAVRSAESSSMDYRLRRFALVHMPFDPKTATWEQWIQRETSKRLLCGIFIMTSLMTVTYDISPVLSVTQDLEMDLLDDECLWDATTSEQWDSLRKTRSTPSKPTVRDALSHLIYGKEVKSAHPNATRWTAFATTMIFHAVNVHMWSVMQSTQSFTAFAVDEQNNMFLSAAIASQTESALARCYALLVTDRTDRDHTSDDSDDPLIFNCLAILRSAWVRLFSGSGNFDRMMLLSEDPFQVARSIQAYVNAPQERSSLLTQAVGKAYGGLLTPIKAGYILVQKTAALSWSIEHAVAGWDCALFVVKWIHAVEMEHEETPANEDEMLILNNFRGLLTEVDTGYDGHGSLAASVAVTWAGFYDDTWVFGITPRMGHALRQISEVITSEWVSRLSRIRGSEQVSE